MDFDAPRVFDDTDRARRTLLSCATCGNGREARPQPVTTARKPSESAGHRLRRFGDLSRVRRPGLLLTVSPFMSLLPGDGWSTALSNRSKGLNSGCLRQTTAALQARRGHSS